jgi:UDP-N-acetylmuramoylalanine--D-glutamate ligase
MSDLENKEVLVIGLGRRGQAACELLRNRGAKVVAVDTLDTDELRAVRQCLSPLGVNVELGVSTLPKGAFSLAVLNPAVPANQKLVHAIMNSDVPLISELELGAQRVQCLSIAIAGTNGKGTTAELIERVLINNERKTLLAGHRARPICSVIEQSKDLDYLILKVNAFQLETAQSFRPAVAVLMNLAPDHLDRYASAEDYARAYARLFGNQQSFDWAIVQSDALARLQRLNLAPRAKTITFSATDPEAELHLDRGLLISRVPTWTGPLLNLEQCQLRGPHNVENLMAALAVGHVLRLPLERMVEPLKTYTPGPHRFELIAEINGVQFINDSKATNPDALHKALLATRTIAGGQPNIWLIAGGQDRGLDFHDIGPAIAKRVKHAFLLGEAREKIRAAWSLFTACTISNSLIEAIAEAANRAASGDVVLLSPACSSFDQYRNYQQRGEMFCQAVKSIGRGAQSENPHMHGGIQAP